MSITKNQEAVLEITGTTHDGSGVGRLENMVVFTPGCAQGDKVRVKIIAVKKDYAFGLLLEVIEPSSSRIKIDCPVFFKCGGCAFRHISYDQELRIKYGRVSDALTKIAKLKLVPDEIEGSPETEGYRNKAQYPVGLNGNTLSVGFFCSAQPQNHPLPWLPFAAARV